MNAYPSDAVPVVRVTVAVPRHDFFLTATPPAEVYAFPYVPAPHPGALAPHGTADGGHPSAQAEPERQALAWDAARERARAVARTVEREVGGHPDVGTVWADGDTVHVLLRLEPPFARWPGWCAYFGITASAECTAPHILAGEGSRDGVRVTAAVQPAGPPAGREPGDAGGARPGVEGTPGAAHPVVAEDPGGPEVGAAPRSVGGHEHPSAGLGSFGGRTHPSGRREELDGHEHPPARGEFGDHEHPPGWGKFGGHEHPAVREEFVGHAGRGVFVDHEHPAGREGFGGREHPAPQGDTVLSESLDAGGAGPDGQGAPDDRGRRDREHLDAEDPGLRDQEHLDGTAPADDAEPDGTGAGGRPDRGGTGLGLWTELAASGVLPLAHLAGTGHDEPDGAGAGTLPDLGPWAGPEGQARPDDPASPRPAGGMRPFLLGGTAYDLALPYRDVHGETWYFQGQRSFDGMPLMSLDGRPERCSLAHVAEYAGPLTPVPESAPGAAPDEGDR
ncbi:BN159_2729 family protein [Streptomyces sp. NPDC086843]|uniref:BN159_2729 family protein n=1 Tax=Streptomyces sp. NPDC086843 TaxID=3365763 RepID=UPI003827E45C